MIKMIDIALATYNGERYLTEQVESILHQSYNNIRIIIRDDGSTDNTLQIITELQNAYPDKIVLVKDHVKCGSSASNFMQILQHTTAEYVMFSDQDDIWLPDKVLHTLQKMTEAEKKVGQNRPVLVFGSYEPVDQDLQKMKIRKRGRQEAAYKLDFSNLLVQNYVNGCLMMVNRTLADMMGEYDERMLMHDWWAALIAAGGGAIEHVDEVMMLYRQHGSNVVGSVNVKSFKYRFHKLLDPQTKVANQLYLKQAELLRERCDDVLCEDHRQELSNFIGLYNEPKHKRVAALIRGRFLKSDFIRILGQLWYI